VARRNSPIEQCNDLENGTRDLLASGLMPRSITLQPTFLHSSFQQLLPRGIAARA
jgi:hypothetical protein